MHWSFRAASGGGKFELCWEHAKFGLARIGKCLISPISCFFKASIEITLNSCAPSHARHQYRGQVAHQPEISHKRREFSERVKGDALGLLILYLLKG